MYETLSCICGFVSLQGLGESDYANLQQLGVIADPHADEAPPDKSRGLFLKNLKDNWDMYTDKATHRPFYVNRVDDVTQWKPPRGDFHKESEKKVIIFILLVLLRTVQCISLYICTCSQKLENNYMRKKGYSTKP